MSVRRLAASILAGASLAHALRTVRLPRAPLTRGARGAAELDPNSSVLLWDTVRVGARVVLPHGAGDALVFKPLGSSATVRGGAFTPDVSGDYVVAFSGGASPAAPSACGAAPAAAASTAALRFASWDFAAADTHNGVFMRDSFSSAGLASSDTAFGLWAPPPACAAEAPSGGLVLTGSCRGLETAAAAGNPFQEGLLLSLAAASPPDDGVGALRLAVTDAYGGGANLTLALTASAYTLVSWTGLAIKTLASGSLSGVCSAGSGGGGGALAAAASATPAFDVHLTVAELEVGLAIACAGGAAGAPVLAAHLPQPWNYRLWGLGVSGAVRLGLSTGGGAAAGAVARVASILGQSVLPPYMPLSETAPVTQLGLFGRPALGASQPRAAMGIIDVSAQPFAADPTGVEDSTRALQDALDWCYQHHLVAFLPVGAYTVSDTLELVQVSANNESYLYSSRYTPFIIQGERLSPAASASAAQAGLPTRATLVLAPSSPGFTDPATGKLVLFVHTYNPAGQDQPNVAFNNVAHSLDIVIGAGNAGAVGVGLRGAQGTSLEDVTVHAGDGAIGVMGLAGSGGAHSNITVVGGRFGVDGRGAQRPRRACPRSASSMRAARGCCTRASGRWRSSAPRSTSRRASPPSSQASSPPSTSRRRAAAPPRACCPRCSTRRKGAASTRAASPPSTSSCSTTPPTW